MNASTLEPLWGLRRWMIWTAVIFGAQVLLIFVLSARPRVSFPPPSKATTLKIFNRPMTETEFSKNFLVSDPTLFAAARRDGFSGKSWLQVPSRDYEAQISVTRAERPFWLALNPSELGTFPLKSTRPVTAPLSFAENAEPKIQLTPANPLENAQTNSQLRVEGDLTARKLLSIPSLRNWEHTDLLSNTVTQVAVDQNGLVVSTRLLAKSGSTDADRWAMNEARLAQFAPALTEITWGKLVFDWMTLPMPTTNAPMLISSP